MVVFCLFVLLGLGDARGNDVLLVQGKEVVIFCENPKLGWASVLESRWASKHDRCLTTVVDDVAIRRFGTISGRRAFTCFPAGQPGIYCDNDRMTDETDKSLPSLWLLRVDPRRTSGGWVGGCTFPAGSKKEVGWVAGWFG